MTRFLIDLATAVSPGGVRLGAELIRALDRSRPLGASGVVLRRADQMIPALHHLEDMVVGGDLRSPVHRWTWLSIGLPSMAERCAATAVFCTNGIVRARLSRAVGVVATTNNMTLFEPTLARGLGLSPARARLWLVRRAVVRGLQRADAVVLHSRHALERVSRYAGDLSAKTTVVLTGIPEGCRLDPANPPAHPEGVERPYFFYLSAIRRYKNHLTLIEAYRKLRARHADAPELFLAGVPADRECLDEINAALESPELEGRARYLGEIPDADIPGWLHHATVNVFPSLLETNSLVIAEVLGMHGVLAVTGEPPTTEVVRDAAATFDPRNANDIAATLEALWLDGARRADLRGRAARRAAALCWESAGEALWDAAGQVTSRRQKPTSGA